MKNLLIGLILFIGLLMVSPIVSSRPAYLDIFDLLGAKDKGFLVIVLKDGRELSYDVNAIARIEFRDAVDPMPSPSPTVKPTPKTTPTPTQDGLSATGIWRGNWSNSKGESGVSVITIKELAGGVITGDEDGSKMVNGRRSGNIITFQFKGLGNGCRDAEVRMEISSDGKTMAGNYSVINLCGNPTKYTGQYRNYRK